MAIAISSLPVKTIHHLLSYRRVVVVAPHPDDETLGCGGAIALLRQHNIPVQVLVISDGTQSHPSSKRFPAEKLRQVRESEAISALEILGVTVNNITFLRWPDTAVPQLGENDFLTAVEQCDRALQSISPDLVFIPWQFDQHCDHQATWQIVHDCLRAWLQPPHQLMYSIWGDRAAGLPALPAGETGWRLDISQVENIKRRAAMAHRSQTTNLINDDPNGFQLTAEMLHNLISPYEIYLESH